MARMAEVTRKTKETDIAIKLDLDGTGKSQIETGIGFFNHMLEGFSKHGLFDLECIYFALSIKCCKLTKA